MKALSKRVLARINDPTTELIPIYWPGESGRTSVRVPHGLKAKIDELLSFIYETTGARFSRNEFIVKAIRFYLASLLQAKSKRDLVAKVEMEAEIT